MEELDMERILSGEGAVVITQSGAHHRSEVDELIPIVNLGAPLPSLENIEPFNASGDAKHPVLTVQGPDNKAVTYYSLHPAQLYDTTDNWVQEHSLAFGNWIRNDVISFVRSVAGMQGVNVSDLLQTGFEDLTAIMRETLPRSHDLFLPSGNGGGQGQFAVSVQGQGEEAEGGTEEEDETDVIDVHLPRIGKIIEKGKLPKKGKVTYRTPYSAEALTDLVQLAKQLHGFGDSTDVLRVYRYLTTRNERYDYGIVKWLTLPMNLSKIYFKEPLKAALESALSDVLVLRDMLDNETLFAEILHSSLPVRNTFTRLVSAYLDLRKWVKTRSDKTKHEREFYEQSIKSLSFQLRNVDFGGGAVVATPQFNTTSSVMGEFAPI